MIKLALIILCVVICFGMAYAFCKKSGTKHDTFSDEMNDMYYNRNIVNAKKK